MDNLIFLDELRKTIPFLMEIPDSIYYDLDCSEFVLPNNAVNNERIMLEKRLGHYVMTYKLQGSNNKIRSKELCGIIKPAVLDQEQLRELVVSEKRLKRNGVSLCVYEKPLVMIDNYDD